MPKKYGFYSQRAANMFGSNVYRAPDKSEVYTTYITDDPTGTEYTWDDRVFKGEVTNWIRRASEPLRNFYFHKQYW